MYSTVYFVGIGGIGMSGLARYLKHRGADVEGYDKTSTLLTQELEQENITILYTDDFSQVKPKFCNQETLVVYTPAIPSDSKILQGFKDLGCRIIKRSVLLGELSENSTTLAVAGTHGKTTTSSMVADFLTKLNVGCTAFLGGVLKETQSNLVLDHIGQSNFYVAEADEFDRSFLQLFPDTAVITSTDADHLDIYSNHENLLQSFTDFASQVKRCLVLKKGIKLPFSNIKAKVYTYSYNEPCDFYATNFRIENNIEYFDIVTPTMTVKRCSLKVGGWVNVENAVAAAAVLYLQNINIENLGEILPLYQGIRRRLDCHIATKNLVYIDDYAHHPTELSVAISSLRKLYPNKKMTAIFQPHLYTRTRDFADGFAESLSKVDELYLLPIYPARELPIEGVDSAMIFDKITLQNKHLLEPAEVLQQICKDNVELLVTFGAGDIDKLIVPLKEKLQ